MEISLIVIGLIVALLVVVLATRPRNKGQAWYSTRDSSSGYANRHTYAADNGGYDAATNESSARDNDSSSGGDSGGSSGGDGGGGSN